MGCLLTGFVWVLTFHALPALLSKGEFAILLLYVPTLHWWALSWASAIRMFGTTVSRDCDVLVVRRFGREHSLTPTDTELEVIYRLGLWDRTWILEFRRAGQPTVKIQRDSIHDFENVEKSFNPHIRRGFIIISALIP